MTYTEADLREAFKAGWKERDKSPGLKSVPRNSLNNVVLGAMGGGRFAEKVLVPAHKPYHNSIWLRSDYRKAQTNRLIEGAK